MKHIVFGSGTKNFVILPGLSVHSVMGLADAIAEAYKDFCEEYTVYVFDRAENIQRVTRSETWRKTPRRRCGS
mgnify:FL=1